MKEGIYILANDYVYDHLMALLNSIEANAAKEMPICIIPYDDNIKAVRAQLKLRKNLMLFEDKASISCWENFVSEIWRAHPAMMRNRQQKDINEVCRLGLHRKFCAFDGPFERFVYFDADTLLMKPLDAIFDKLDKYDFVVYDFQHKHPQFVYNLKSPILPKVFSEKRIASDIFCTGFFASRRSLFNDEKRSQILNRLRNGEAEVLFCCAPDQTILNYMVMRSEILVYNLALNLPADEITGNSITSVHFQQKDNILYDKGRRLTYLHYIGLPPIIAKRVCSGENLDFPYREIFLQYRYLKNPQERPQLKGILKQYNQRPGLTMRALRKLKSAFLRS